MHIGGRSLEKIERENVGQIDNNLEVAFSQVEVKMEVLKNNFYKIIDKMEKSTVKWERVPLKWPIEGWISSQFGWRESPFAKKREFHTGLDITNIPGTPVKAPAQGYVKFAGWLGEYGKTVVIEHGFGYETRYGHLDKILVKKGRFVKKDDKLGTLGNTGRSSAPHLHYEILKNGKVENPMKYLLTEDNKILRRVSQFYGR
jgi:murein DD-endopeptidase MepM/ murein hydrolase activator NlpD